MSTLQAQILGNRFSALAAEGATGFAAMSRSPLVIDEGQYACAILDGTGRLIAQDQGEPSHLAAVQASVAHLLDAFAFNISEGDVILTGDPYCGGTWGGVLTLAVPVFYDGELEFISALRFAAADLAGNVPGPFQPDAHEIWQEALRITPVKLVRAGAPQKDIRAYVTRNTRASALLGSDLTTAMVTAQRIGARISQMIAQKGLALVRAAAEQRIAYGAARAQAALANVPASTGRAGGVAVRLTPGTPLVVDLTYTDPAREDASNLTPAATKAAVLTQLAAEVIEDAGLSQGILDAVSVIAPEGSIAHASFPAAVSMGWRMTAPLLAQALAQATGTQAAIYPAAPLVMLFPEIGAGPVSQPVALSPGFTPAHGCAGSDAASGRRRIISAEEAEATGLVLIERRGWGNEGIQAEIRIVQDGFEGIVVPGGTEPLLSGAHERPRSNVLSLPAGSGIKFTYLTQEGPTDAQQ